MGRRDEVRIAVILTAHNRLQLTLRCLQTLREQQLDGLRLSVHLCDDGSTDGTAEAVRRRFPGTTVIAGSGNLFWNRGMRAAWASSLVADPDAYLWVNDDTELASDAVARLVAVWREGQDAGTPRIIVGAVADPDTGELSYGGVRQRLIRRVRFELVEPGVCPQPVDTMNGNCVLVPREIYERVGMVDPVFQHSMGDLDYGLRATAAGCDVVLAPGIVGTCRANPGFRPGDDGLRNGWARLRSIKHLPPGEWREFVHRWGGPQWPALLALSYATGLWRIMKAKFMPQRGGA